ncbi:MAG TPA: O-antigen ligase family protein [Candidatus Paceibacterota bacterium]|nr:O-antigen ligase family protein [Candidatus Paceibacterota bacterium]
MKDAARWIAIVALFAVPFLPLFVSSTLFFPFITGKVFAFRILVEIAFAAYIVLAVIDRRYRPRFSWTLALFGLLTAWMAIANAFGVNPHKAFWSNFERMDGWVLLVHLFAFFVVAGSVLGVEKLWRKWWLYFVSVAAAVCAYGLIQLGGGAEIHQGGLRLTASLGNAIYLAVYLMFAILIAAWLSVKSEGMVRNALLAFIPLAALILFFTGSRGPLLGLIAGAGFAAVLWIFLSRGEWKTGASKGLKLATGTLIALAVVAGAFFLVRESAFVQQSPILARAASVFSLNQELKVRQTIWGMALQGVAEDPITGWGQEGFNQVFNKYYEPSLYKQEAWFDRVHNMYLDWLVAGGVPALLLFVALLLFGARALLRDVGYTRAERVLLVSALVAYAVQALVVFDNLFSYVPFVVLLAMAHHASGRAVGVVEELPEPRSEVGGNIVGAAAIVLALALVWTLNVPGMRTGVSLIAAISPMGDITKNLRTFKQILEENPFASQEVREQLVTFAATVVRDERTPNEVKREFAMLAVDEMGKEVQANPNDARLRVLYAQAYETAGKKQQALEEVDVAIRLSPRKQSLHLNRAVKLYELDRYEEAREAFVYAYDLDRQFPEVAISAAAGLVLAGDSTRAKTLLAEAVGTTTVDSDALFYAYYETKQWNDLVATARARVVAEGNSAESRYRLAQALAAAQRFSEARAEVAATMSAHPETSAKGQALLAQIPAL